MALFPQIQKVTADLVCKLERIRKAAGFRTDLAVVVATFALEAMTDRDAEAVVAIDSFEILDDESGAPIGFTDQIQTYRISVFVRVSDDSVTPMHDRVLIAAADIEEALLADVTRGGTAIDTVFKNGTLVDARDQGFYGLDLYFDVHLRHVIGQPFDTRPAD